MNKIGNRGAAAPRGLLPLHQVFMMLYNSLKCASILRAMVTKITQHANDRLAQPCNREIKRKAISTIYGAVFL